MIISLEAKLSGICETGVWDKSHIPWLVVEHIFILSKGIFQLKRGGGWGLLKNRLGQSRGIREFIQSQFNQNATNLLDIE